MHTFVAAAAGGCAHQWPTAPQLGEGREELVLVGRVPNHPSWTDRQRRPRLKHVLCATKFARGDIYSARQLADLVDTAMFALIELSCSVPSVRLALTPD